MIIRAEKRETFTVISNQLINDNRISDKALGTLVRLLAKPDNWNLNINHMVKTGKQGRTAVRSSIAELEKAGYIHRDVVRNQAGRITGTEYVVYEHAAAKGVGQNITQTKECTGQPATIMETPSTTEGCSNLNSPPVENDSPNLGQPLIREEVPETLCDGQSTPLNETATRDKNQSQENRSQETSPVINTNIEQTLRVTTTPTPATPAESAPEPEPAIDVEVLEPPSSSSYPATEDIKSLLDLIPEHHRKPTVEKLVREALGHHDSHQVKEAVMYAADNVRGGWMQFRAYLDKSLQNGWAVGYLDHQADPAAAWMDTGTMVPAVVNQGRQRARFANGSITGSHRMDDNYRAGMEFMMMMGVEV